MVLLARLKHRPRLQEFIRQLRNKSKYEMHEPFTLKKGSGAVACRCIVGECSVRSELHIIGGTHVLWRHVAEHPEDSSKSSKKSHPREKTCAGVQVRVPCAQIPTGPT